MYIQKQAIEFMRTEKPKLMAAWKIEGEKRGKLEVDPWGATLSDVQHHRTGREELPPNRQRPSSRRSTPARAGKSSLTEAPLPSDEAVPPQPAREDRTLGPAGRGAGAAPPHGPGRTRPARQRP